MITLSKNIPLLELDEDSVPIVGDIRTYDAIQSSARPYTYDIDENLYYVTFGYFTDEALNQTDITNLVINFKPDIYNDSLIAANLHLSLSLDNSNNITASVFADQTIDLEFDGYALEAKIVNPNPEATGQPHIFTDSSSTWNIDIADLTADLIGSRETYIALSIVPDTTTDNLATVNLLNSYISITYQAVVPFAPLNVTVDPGYQQLFVSWDPPRDNGGSNITLYQIEYTTYIDDAYGDWTIAGTTDALSFSVENLTNNVNYVFRVAAINDVGLGAYSVVSIPEYPRPGLAPRASNTFNDSNYTRIRLRRDIATNWSGINPVLGLGEAGFESDTRLLKIGDNNTAWNELNYIKADYSDIVFPEPPEISITIGDSPVNADSPRLTCNLSQNEKLNIVANNGINLEYNPGYNALSFSLDRIFTPFSSGFLYSPTTQGSAGSVFYDDEYMYFCVAPNRWKRILLEQRPWFAPETIAISNDTGFYPSTTNIYFSGANAIIVSDGDPYPAKASTNLANDGAIPRSDFFNSYQITDQDYNFSLRYRGGSNTASPEIAMSGFNGIFANGVLFSSSSAGLEPVDIFPPPSGFRYNRTHFGTYFKVDDCGGHVNFDRKYIYQDGRFLKRCWDDSKVFNSNIYYSGSHYQSDHFRHPDGHSKILGFAFDGYPIYGPFGYSDTEDRNSESVLMRSSYVSYENDDHRPEEWKYNNSITVDDIDYNLTAGAFIEDFYYAEGSGTLDQYNGRYSVTPEYPDGTYAYYLTFTSESLIIPEYPYIMGNYSKQKKVRQDIFPSLYPLTIDGYFPLFIDGEAAEKYGLLNGGDGTYDIIVVNTEIYYWPVGVYRTVPFAPTDITISENRISEKATLNAIVGAFVTNDNNTTDYHEYSLVSGDGDTDNNNFIIHKNELRVNAILNYAAQSSHSIRVRTTDQTNRSFEKQFTINVLEGASLTSLSITSDISSLIAGNSHTFSTSVVSDASDIVYSWNILGSPYISSTDLNDSSLTINSIDKSERNDETISIFVTAKSLSAFTTLIDTTSFILDHSEIPKCINGYYPLYNSSYDANRDPDGDGTSHIHTVLGIVYWMPNGLSEHYHGTYDCSSL